MGESYTNRRISVHQALGGSSVADVLLWKRWGGALLTLGSATILWFLFERAGYNLLSFVSNVLLLLVVILFVWAKSATLLNRPLPPIPNLEISEDTIAKASGVTRLYINYALSIAHDITIKRNLRLFLQVAICLWLGSYIGGLCNFLTLVYVGALLSFSLPVFYDKYQDWIDERLCIAQRLIETQYRKIDDTILKKLPVPSNNRKKTQ